MTTNNVNPEDLAKARELYFQYYPVTEIARRTGINRSTVQYHVMHRWKAERAMVKQDLLSTLLDGKEESLAKITDFSIRALERAVREIATRDQAPSVMEARNIVTILEKIDQIVTKDKKDAEETSKKEASNGEHLSIEQIKQSIASDPFTKN